jgi:hypothetical protein
MMMSWPSAPDAQTGAERNPTANGQYNRSDHRSRPRVVPFKLDLRPRALAVRIAKAEERYVPFSFGPLNQPAKIAFEPAQQQPPSAPSRFVLPAYLQLSDRISPHLMAHNLIHSDAPVDEVIAEYVPRHQREMKLIMPSITRMDHGLKTNRLFYDLYYTSPGLGDYEFVQVVSYLHLFHLSKIQRACCQLLCIRIASQGSYGSFLIDPLISLLRPVRGSHVVPVLGPCQSPKEHSEKTAFLAYFSQKVSEFEDHQKPPTLGAALPPFDPPVRRYVDLGRKESYIFPVNYPFQKDVFESFVLNYRYAAVVTGGEGVTVHDEEQIFESETYFAETCIIPKWEVTLGNLKRSYALLSAEPLPRFCRFPIFLVRTLSLIYEKMLKKVIDLMTDRYEEAAPIVAEALLGAIEKAEMEMPKLLAFMRSRNNSFASKPHFAYPNYGRVGANARLDSPVDADRLIEIKEHERYVLHFLRAYYEVTRPNDSHIELFFEILGDLRIEILIQRPFAGALMMIPRFSELFKELEKQFDALMADDSSLKARERFLIKVAEKMTGISESEADSFLCSDAPLSMRMFFDYAVYLSVAKKDVSPQRLTFATFLGFSLMKEIETFSCILSSLGIGGDFIALCDIYYEKIEHENLNYVKEAAEILQGRSMFGISVTENGDFQIRKVESKYGFWLSASFAFLLDSHLSAEDGGENMASDTQDPTE